ncbi:flavodoxin [Pontibacillus halophilus JSM 076056 = DSM 19796]|uniref:Flavodoxin n=1 Tax=Pontibacillus halophilus JSM 076056 = DSM 19796 TaxID=1385510 RepID=A0A0A5GK15_9BACI|nr:NAD(P)H-dependent oxidoreductase [Pontibacillus halophilus]KGX92354.1 flavodoxin [Pontibacillus halophilus JSM 076056 = DSM 19796]
MRNILIINGHQYYPFAKGQLNKTLFDEIVSNIEGSYKVQTTVIDDGYDVKEEQEKFKWADAIIMQTPLYWFSLPGATKTYFDLVYEYGVFFGGESEYGNGGLMTGKKFMISTTWNAPEYAFNDESKFFQGKTLDEALDHLHNMNKYVGMEPMKSFGAHDVIANPDVEKYVTELRQHLKEQFNV